MNSVSGWTAGLITGLTAGLSRFFGAIPNIIGAIILIVIGWIVAGIVGKLFAKLCRALHIDTVSTKAGVNDFLSKAGTRLKASDILGEIVAWVIRLVFIEMAAEQLGMPQVTQIVDRILGFIPNIVVAILILCIGAFLGKLLAGIVHGGATEAKIGNAGLLARLTYGAVMAFAIIATLNQLDVAPVVVNTVYIGLVAALALALGLAFGLGGRETAAKLTERWAAQLDSTAKKVQSLPPKASPTAAMPQNMKDAPPIRTTR